MASYNVHGGHNKIVPGASSYLDEVTEDRKVCAEVIQLLQAEGHSAYNCTDDSGSTQSKNQRCGGLCLQLIILCKGCSTEGM